MDIEPVGLALVGGELGQELVVGHACRGGEAGLLADPRPDRLGDVGGERNTPQVLGDVEVGLVERERLDHRRVLGEDGADLLRHGLVDLEARLDEDEIRALAPRRHGRHRRAHPEDAGLVARCRHHATLAGAADGHGLAAQGRIVALLHRGEEGVHVDVDDLAGTLDVSDRLNGDRVVDDLDLTFLGVALHDLHHSPHQPLVAGSMFGLCSFYTTERIMATNYIIVVAKRGNKLVPCPPQKAKDAARAITAAERMAGQY